MTDFMTPAHYVLEDGSDSMDLALSPTENMRIVER